MPDPISDFFTWAVRDIIFSSGDVKTTTIALAITSSLCCSLILAVIHVMALISPTKGKKAEVKRSHSISLFSQQAKKPCFSSMFLSGGKVHVPCVKCGNFYADEGCRFVTCKECCFSVLSCDVHQKKSLASKPCQGITSMDLSNQGISQCPGRLGFVGAQLTCLNLSDNNLQELPAEIGCLRGLQKLSLRCNQLQELPSTLGSLSKLTKLDVSANSLVKVPDCIGSLVNLNNLNLFNNQLQSISPEVGRLKQLHSLNLGFNNIEDLCFELFTVIHLKYLSVRHNPLQTLPAAIGNLVQLLELDARSCDLKSIPASIGQCTSLVCLSLDHNRLTSVPLQIGRLCHLRSLSIKNNKLPHLPATLTFLPDTVTILVNSNPLISPLEAKTFEESLKPFQQSFPSLKELTARKIAKRNIPYDETLPSTLQTMLASPSYCSHCGGPMFEYFSGKVEFWLLEPGVDEIPLYRQLCSPHQPQGCG